jgi:adenylosuccinate lyase
MNPDTQPLLALSPLDGRYARRTRDLARITGEFGLHRARFAVQAEWLLALAEAPDFPALAPFSDDAVKALRIAVHDFDVDDAARIRAIEARTNHDVKAVEYHLREVLGRHSGLAHAVPFVHFACTSEDVNNLAYAQMLAAARSDVLLPRMDAVIERLAGMAETFADLPMLARTHGQTATPTTLGKELRVFSSRLSRQREQFAGVVVLGKLNGATGNYNAHEIAVPELDWPALARRVIERLGLTPNPWTTQIEPHDWIAEYAHAVMRFDRIVLDLCRDVWGYVSLGYFRQRLVEGEVGSSTMPHKVNPIDFENAEGNLGLADALLAHLAEKLPVSRWQRDLSDSTVLRNLGSALGYADLAWQTLLRGLDKLEADPVALRADLDGAWEVLGEAVQTVLRAEGVEDAYERLKAATRGRRLDAAAYRSLLEELPLSAGARERLAALTPATYLGLAPRLARGEAG